MVGRAIASERSREFLDDKKKQSLDLNTYATLYGEREIAEYYDTGHVFR